ncbi:4-hydroxythreonine-4-phosphate dehydrogenase PdxA [Thalassococcus sp. S3]|uniref:4-hydroxythreonine-4-phosphate dehydrogenase PdxA n=1 Tax=Thalassococcus sp. S3 TaxID=2017482 RepID=UPI00102432B2|nr:4-hydroxythreonine-4-phosphate dehydrogenase PdxA [Thalassococcus sp. S3]QBF33474.1 4-hydroxythreonine-4-phosphate dehydrogenase [Thalassococcus sp. S3]
MTKPRLAVIPGDPSGIGPELLARLLAEDAVRQAADILLVGDGHLWRQGAGQAGVELALDPLAGDEVPGFSGVKHLEMDTIAPEDVKIAKVTTESGASALRTLDKALDLAMAGEVDGVLFGPFNKAALTAAGLNAEDEHRYMARYLGFEGYHSEINVLDELMTTRVTSHIGLREVAENISAEGIRRAIGLAHDTLVQSGKSRPHVAVAALNPHAGDNGKFGREEIDVIGPVVTEYQDRQMHVTGPWPSDTVFLKAKAGEVDAVVTMYHDQGQIAIKLMGFDRGVTVAGGLPVPVTTPAHGTAFDIAGQGIANVGATRSAFDLLVRLATTHRVKRLAPVSE